MSDHDYLKALAGSERASPEAIVAAAGLIDSTDAALKASAVSAILGALQSYASEPEKIAVALATIRKTYSENPIILEFADNARKALDELLNRVYAEIIDPRRGSPCCPVCKSPNVREAGGAYEFALMRCFDCGNEEYADPYQIGDWFV